MAFRGWSDAAIDFYDGLEEDNSRSYWQAHRPVYEQEVKAPFEELLAELTEQFGPGRLFRPYRDVRFSADKSPYKTAIAAMVGTDGYLQLSAAGLVCGRGMYAMGSEQLQRFRAAVDAEVTGAEVLGLTDALAAAGFEITAYDRVKTAPRGFARDHPRIALLVLKGCAAMKQWPVQPWLATSKVKQRVVDTLEAAGPLCDWLEAHVGSADTAAPPGR